MDTNIVGVGVGITDRFRSVVEEKLVRIEHLAPRAQRIDVKVTHRTYRTGRVEDHTVELTLTGKGPLVRAEATDADKFTALDMAVDKLCEQLRRAKDKRVDQRNHPRGAKFAKESGALQGIDLQPASAEAIHAVSTGEIPTVGGAATDSSAVRWRFIRERLHSVLDIGRRRARPRWARGAHNLILIRESQVTRAGHRAAACAAVRGS